MRSVVPEAGIKGRYKWLHPTVYVGCNYLPLLLMPASGTTLLIHPSNTVWSNGGPTSGRMCRRLTNVGPIRIAVWNVYVQYIMSSTHVVLFYSLWRYYKAVLGGYTWKVIHIFTHHLTVHITMFHVLICIFFKCFTRKFGAEVGRENITQTATPANKWITLYRCA